MQRFHRYGGYIGNGWSTCDICGTGTREHFKCEICGILLGRGHYGGEGVPFSAGILYLIDEYGVWDNWQNYLIIVNTQRVPLTVCEDCFRNIQKRSDYRKNILEGKIKG